MNTLYMGRERPWFNTHVELNESKLKKKLNSVAFSPQANYTDRATAAL
jgi:hypothetical protein